MLPLSVVGALDFILFKKKEKKELELELHEIGNYNSRFS